MTVEDCYQVGYIIKPHGLKGEVQILLDVDNPREYTALESVFVRQGQDLVPFFLESISINQDKAIVKFEDIDDVDQAKSIKSQELFMPLATLPELPDDKFYFHELEGFLVEDEVTGVLGEVTNLIEAGNQKLLAVAHPSGKEILLPFNDELITSFKKRSKLIKMSVPEGLIDIYLNESS